MESGYKSMHYKTLEEIVNSEYVDIEKPYLDHPAKATLDGRFTANDLRLIAAEMDIISEKAARRIELI